MNIMFIIFSFNIGGIERLLIDMCNNMVQKQNHVSLCIINHDYTDSLLNELSPDVKVFRLERPVGTRFSIRQMNALALLVRKEHIQILHCQGINCVLFSSVAKILHPSMIVLNTVHDSGNYPSYPAAKIRLQNLFCSATIAISESVRSEILARNMDPSKVITIYNAINTEKFQYIPRNSSRSFNPEDKIELGNVARIFPAKKGQDTLVRAVELLIPKYPHLHCRFAGEVYKGQQDAYQHMLSYIRTHHLDDHISFLGNVNDIPAFLRDTDIFILPSNFEGFGISLIEAMSTGLPSIASNLEGPAEIISSPELGMLFTAGNAAELAEAIDQMIRNYTQFDPCRISAYVKKNFDIETMVSKHLALYQTLSE